MRRRRPAARTGVVAALTALATAAGGCSVSLVDRTSRAGGFDGASYVSRGQFVSTDDVPVRGHFVRVTQMGGGEVAGELIAADQDEIVIAPPQGSWVRIPISRARSISVGLASPQAGAMMLISLGAMLAGLAGLASNPDRSSVSAFFGGWGVIWLPFGLIVALPSALVLLATGDGTLSSATIGMTALVHDLYQFARFPQGEPARKRKPPPSIAPARAPAAVPPDQPIAPPPSGPPAPSAAPPPPIQTVPLVAPPAAAPPSGSAKPKPGARPPVPPEPEDDSEPAVVPYSPDESSPPPKR
ncbi:MAG TPA: hypothetical protein VIF57_25295 [Polyangia bacterium]